MKKVVRRYTARSMKRSLRQFGVTSTQFTVWAGGYTPAKFLASNPTWGRAKVEAMIRDNAEAMKEGS